jgi:hypothetical protein
MLCFEVEGDLNMRGVLKSPLILLFIFILSQSGYADGILLSWSSRDVSGVTEQSFNAAKQLNAEQIQKKNLEVTTWADAFLLMVAANQHKDDKTLLKGLVSQVIDKTKVDLKFTNRLIIWERITTGEIQFEGKGYQVGDDLFTVAGRANWALRNLTKKNFGFVKPNTSESDFNNLQQKWTRFLGGEQAQEYENPYPTSEKGLEEIRSPEALEALIHSLAPTNEKERLTKDCLTRLYHLDKLPDDPSSPAALCSPDKYTLGNGGLFEPERRLLRLRWLVRWLRIAPQRIPPLPREVD